MREKASKIKGYMQIPPSAPKIMERRRLGRDKKFIFGEKILNHKKW
jgi:hypothetical protein